MNLITTGAFTVEHAGGAGPGGFAGSVDDSHSYNTNIDFLNHFAATNSVATIGEQHQAK